MAMTDNLRPALRFWWGQVLALLKMNSRALETYRAVTRDNPRHQQAWSCIGVMLAERDQHAALEAFERALAIDPGDAASHFNVGFLLQGRGRHEEAIARFNRTIEIDPLVDRAWYGLGLSLASLGQHAQAAEKFEEAARLQPMNPYAGYQLAGARHKLGEHEKVRAEYLRVKGFDPKVAERIRVEFGVSAR